MILIIFHLVLRKRKLIFLCHNKRGGKKMLLDYINKVVQIWLLATTGISAITTTIIMIEYSFVIVTDLKKKIKK